MFPKGLMARWARQLSLGIILNASPVAVTGSIPEPPDWALDARWYQIFPERFRNSTTANDPVVQSLGLGEYKPVDWEISDWTGDWYALAGWETASGQGFYDSVFKRRYGGDLQGVIDKLDYLKELGINALYFNPIFHAESLHKYDASSYHHIDPFFGPDPAADLLLVRDETEDPATWQWTAADKLFLELIQQAHKREMRVIIDGVWNHTGRDFFAFRDILKNQQQSRYKEWFSVNRWDIPDTKHNEFDYNGWFGFKALPEFRDTEDGLNLAPGPKRYVFEATRRWMDPNGDGDPSDGVDGWRLDVAEQMPTAFWRDWNAYVRTLNPEVYTTAEIWGSARHFLEETQFTACMNYAGFAIPVKGWLVDDGISVREFSAHLRRERELYEPATFLAMQNLVDSHDTQRIASAIVNRPPKNHHYHNTDWYEYDGDSASPRKNRKYQLHAPEAEGRAIWKMVALMQAAYTGAPMIYYGTEAGMWGADDPCDRKPMVWQDLAYVDESHHPLERKRKPDPVGFDKEIYQAYEFCMRMRTYSKALRRGDYRELLVDDSRNCFAFARVKEDKVILVLFNRSEAEQEVAFTLEGLPETGDRRPELVYSTREDVFKPRLQVWGNELRAEIPPLCGLLVNFR